MRHRPAFPKRAPRFYMVLSLLHFAALLLLYLLAEFIGERTWLTTLLAYAPPLLYLVLVPIFLLVSLFRRDRTTLTIDIVALLFGLLVVLGPGAGVLPVRKEAGNVRVMSYNILHGEKGVDKIAAFIKREKAEIVCLQECSPFFGTPDPVPLLMEQLPDWVMVRAGDAAIVSRYPIRNTRIYPLITGGATRIAVEAELEIEGKVVSVFSVHLATAAHPESLTKTRRTVPAYLRHTAQVRYKQLYRLQQATSRTKNPVILCGDFNTPPRGVFYRHLTAEFNDAFGQRGTGFGWTYPADRPCLRIDYIFTKNGAVPRTAYVPTSRTSDHRAVVADIEISP